MGLHPFLHRLLPAAGALLLASCVNARFPFGDRVDTLRGGSPEPGSPAFPLTLASLPPLDEPGDSPYQAPAFEPFPAVAEAGQWERMLALPQPTPRPTPTPVPTPVLLPGETGTYTPLWLRLPDTGMTLWVGQSVQLQAGSSLPAGRTSVRRFGVLETDRATVSPDGKLTAMSSGPVHVYAEQDGQRTYVLVAIRDPAADSFELAIPTGSGPWGTGGLVSSNDDVGWIGNSGTLLRSTRDWETFWSRAAQIPPPPTGVDFDRQTIVAVLFTTNNDGERTPVVTRVRRDTASVVEVTVPDSAPQACICMTRFVLSLTAVPRLPDDARIELVRLRSQELLPPFPPAGPSSLPTPTPAPSPDPRSNLPAGSPTGHPGPPYPPPNPLGNPVSCPSSLVSGGGTGAPFSLYWNDYYGTGVQWEPVLTPGGQMKFHATGLTSPLRWSTLDPRMASVSEDGVVTALRPGALRVKAEGAGAEVVAVIPSVAFPAPALRFRFRVDWATPKASTTRGTQIIRTDDAWRAFWQTNFFYDLPWKPPLVDFSHHDAVVLVDDRMKYLEGEPVLTHVSDSGRVAHLVFPGVANLTSGASYNQVTYLFLAGKLAPDAKVRVHTLCDP